MNIIAMIISANIIATQRIIAYQNRKNDAHQTNITCYMLIITRI